MFDSFNMVHAAAPDTLVLADGDHGYGNAMNVQRTVAAYGRAGAAAVLIEDKITPRALTAAGKPCLPRAEARMKGTKLIVIDPRCTWEASRAALWLGATFAGVALVVGSLRMKLQR